MTRVPSTYCETYEKFGVKYNKSTFPFQDTPSNVQDVLDNYVADKTNKYNQRKFVETFQKPLFPRQFVRSKTVREPLQTLLAHRVLNAERELLNDGFPTFTEETSSGDLAGISGNATEVIQSTAEVRWFINNVFKEESTSYTLDLDELGQRGDITARWNGFSGDGRHTFSMVLS